MAENDDLSPELQTVVRSLRTSRGACPSAEALVEYEALDEGGRSQHAIHDHVQVCARCQLILLNIEDAEPVHASWVRPWMVAAAAVLVLAIALPFVMRPAPDAVEDAVRGAAVRAVEPAGLVAQVRAFVWEGPAAGVRYRVEVLRAGEVLWSRESATRQLAAEGLPPLEPGVEYTWRVQLLDATGIPLRSSAPQPFRLAR